MKFRQYLTGLILLLYAIQAESQDYSAIHGSNYSGGLGVYNNPSSIVISPYKWDLTLLGLQYQAFSNAIRGNNFPLYLSPDSKFSVANGNYIRKADFNTNIRLLNGRFSINKTHAFAFGLNAGTYTQAATSRINYTDSVIGPRTFLALNEGNRAIDLRLASSSWMELYGSYG